MQEMQFETTLRFYLILIRTSVVKKQNKPTKPKTTPNPKGSKCWGGWERGDKPLLC